MKHWKKYAVCIACVCCMAMLTGCGSDDNNKATEKETNAAMTENQAATDGSNTATENGNDTATDNAAGSTENDMGTPDTAADTDGTAM